MMFFVGLYIGGAICALSVAIASGEYADIGCLVAGIILWPILPVVAVATLIFERKN